MTKIKMKPKFPKNLKNVKKITIDVSKEIVKGNVVFDGVRDNGSQTERCCEGHRIRYVFRMKNKDTGEVYKFGSTCILKPFVISLLLQDDNGEIYKDFDFEDENFIRAAKYFYIFKRDNLDKILESEGIYLEDFLPKQYAFDWDVIAHMFGDFYSLAKKKLTVMSKQIRKENAKKKLKRRLKLVEDPRLFKKFLTEKEKSIINDLLNFNKSWSKKQKKLYFDLYNRAMKRKEGETFEDFTDKLALNVDILSNWEKKFLKSVFDKRISVDRELSEKQKEVLNRIVKGKKPDWKKKQEEKVKILKKMMNGEIEQTEEFKDFKEQAEVGRGLKLDKLSDKELGFVYSLYSKHWRKGEYGLSRKQYHWLKGIQKRIESES